MSAKVIKKKLKVIKVVSPTGAVRYFSTVEKAQKYIESKQ